MTYNPFNEHIKQSQDCCDNCFSRIRERQPYDKDALKSSLQGVVSDDVSKTKLATTEHQQSHSVSNSRSIHCANCGSDMDFIERPVTMKRALELSDNLAERINEFDELEVDNRLLRKEVRSLKKDDTNQHDDNSIYSEAVNQTVAICD